MKCGYNSSYLTAFLGPTEQSRYFWQVIPEYGLVQGRVDLLILLLLLGILKHILLLHSAKLGHLWNWCRYGCCVLERSSTPVFDISKGTIENDNSQLANVFQDA